MNIVFFTNEVMSRIYLINEINRYYPIKTVFFETKYSELPSWQSRLKNLLADPKKIRNIRYVIRGILQDLLFGKEQLLRREYESRMFFKNATPCLDPSIRVERVSSLSCSEAVQKIKKEKPDIILVCGTGILKGEILDIAKLNILNIHPGLLPEYRGDPMWCLYNNDFTNLGVTVHVCTKKVDGGDILGRASFQLEKDDKIYTLEHKATMVAVELVKEILNKYKKQAVIYKKQTPSKLWREKDLTIVKMIAIRRNLRKYLKQISSL